MRARAYREWTTYGEWPQWMPESRHVLFVSEGQRFLMLDTKTGNVQTLYTSRHDVIGPARTTRDGKTIFFSRRINETDVWVASLN